MLDRLTDRRAWWSTLGTCAVVFLLTARWYGLVNTDTSAADWPAWQFVRTGSFHLDGLHLPDNPWFFDVHGHVISNRVPGVVLLGLPAQLLLRPFGLSPYAGGAVTAALTCAAAMANTHVLLRRLGGPAATAAGCTAALAFGTGIWPIASAELWTHGPDLLWLSAAALCAQRQRWWLVGVAFAPAVLTRPHLALVAAAVGLTAAVFRRRPLIAVQVGLPCAAALGLLVLWNDLLFGSPSLQGGYPYVFQRATSLHDSGTQAGFGESLVGAFVSPLRGLFLYSPIALVGLVCLGRGWRRAPDWARALLVGGLGYQLAQFKINDFTGGYGFYGNRLVLELLLLAAPVAYLGYLEVVAPHPGRVRVARVLTALSVSIQGLGALLSFSWPIHENHAPAWRDYLPWRVLQDTDVIGPLVLLLLLVTTLLAALRSRAATPSAPVV